MADHITTIRVKSSTHDRVKALRHHEREALNDVIERLLDSADMRPAKAPRRTESSFRGATA